jgi:uncharacterized protein (TIGR00369 family)
MPAANPADGHTPPSQPKPRENHCFACGKDNPQGMHLEFYLDEGSRQAICKFKLSRRYEGPPGHAHGGIIATILDEAMGKVNKLHKVIALTKAMEIEYLKPVPLGHELTAIGREQQTVGRRHINSAEIINEKGEILARSTGTFIAVDVQKMLERFQKSVAREGSS